MKLEAIDGGNVLTLSDARERYRLAPNRCQHRRMLVDEELETVECEDCHERLSAVAMLARFGKEQTQWRIEADRMVALKHALDERLRCKCQHCGQMTRIRP